MTRFPIETARLTLRPVAPGDAAALHRIVSDETVVRMLADWPWPPNPSVTEARCGSASAAAGDLVAVIQEGTVIGMISTVRNRLGYFLAADAWGQGLATEAVRARINAAFQAPEVHYLESCVWEDNPGSLRVLQKCGFVQVGTCRGLSEARGEMVPQLDLRLTRDDWSACDWAT